MLRFERRNTCGQALDHRVLGGDRVGQEREQLGGDEPRHRLPPRAAAPARTARPARSSCGAGGRTATSCRCRGGRVELVRRQPGALAERVVEPVAGPRPGHRHHVGLGAALGPEGEDLEHLAAEVLLRIAGHVGRRCRGRAASPGRRRSPGARSWKSAQGVAPEQLVLADEEAEVLDLVGRAHEVAVPEQGQLLHEGRRVVAIRSSHQRRIKGRSIAGGDEARRGRRGRAPSSSACGSGRPAARPRRRGCPGPGAR